MSEKLAYMFMQGGWPLYTVSAVAVVGLIGLAYLTVQGIRGERPSPMLWYLAPAVTMAVTGAAATKNAWAVVSKWTGSTDPTRRQDLLVGGPTLGEALGVELVGASATVALALLAAVGCAGAAWLGGDELEWHPGAALVSAASVILGAGGLMIWMASSGGGAEAANAGRAMWLPAVLLAAGIPCCAVATVGGGASDGGDLSVAVPVACSLLFAVGATVVAVYFVSVQDVAGALQQVEPQRRAEVWATGMPAIRRAAWFGWPTFGLATVAATATVVSARRDLFDSGGFGQLALAAAIAAVAGLSLAYGAHQIACATFATIP